MKISELLTQDEIDGFKPCKIRTDTISLIPILFFRACSRGIKKLEMVDAEYCSFINYFHRQIPSSVNVVSGKFKFWGIQINRI